MLWDQSLALILNQGSKPRSSFDRPHLVGLSYGYTEYVYCNMCECARTPNVIVLGGCNKWRYLQFIDL